MQRNAADGLFTKPSNLAAFMSRIKIHHFSKEPRRNAGFLICQNISFLLIFSLLKGKKEMN